ncbi:MAG TPA: ankyrin repeat domain-containing protein, partial [Calidithermus sp.]|nr:ankyrin repeat domain-containing protein [Calidithermus sp.]
MGPSAILSAMYAGDTDRLAALLAARPVLDVFEAAAVGDAARLRELLRGDPALVGRRSADGWTALHLAAYSGHGDAVDRLLAAGADPRALSANRLRSTPLHAALAGRGNVRIVAALLARG